MRRFLIKTALFLALTTVVMIVLDLAITHKLSTYRNKTYAVWNDIFHGKASAEVVCVGSSRSWVHYDPAILDTLLGMETYNLGMDGSGSNRHIPRYNLYRLYNAKPKVIIQNIDFKGLKYVTQLDRHQYFPYFYQSELRKRVFPIEPFTLAEKYLPMYRYANYGIFNTLHKKSGDLYKGYRGQDLHWDGSMLEGNLFFHDTIDSTAVEMFDQYLAQAKAEGIKVIMVYAPIYHVVTERIDNLDEMYASFKYFAQKYDIPILDYNYDSLCYDTAYFYNPTHLNKTGATIFSQRVGQDIKNILRDTDIYNHSTTL